MTTPRTWHGSTATTTDLAPRAREVLPIFSPNVRTRTSSSRTSSGVIWDQRRNNFHSSLRNRLGRPQFHYQIESCAQTYANRLYFQWLKLSSSFLPVFREYNKTSYFVPSIQLRDCIGRAVRTPLSISISALDISIALRSQLNKSALPFRSSCAFGQ